ncbi:MAG: hypothetical protein JNL22_12855 [Bacteroidales bacterium]|jgi:hypothetical protein|nr:hypothetical protein [Bacteroidales bacterium]
MKHISFFIAVSLAILSENPAFAQNRISTIFKENKQYVGVQFNPYFSYFHKLFETSYYSSSSKSKVYTLRYGNEFTKNLYAGVDVSGMNYKEESGNRYFEFKPGVFGRYVFFVEKNVQILLEPGIYCLFGNYHFQMMPDPDWTINKFGWYASTGMGINLYKKKVTLDLMVKYSPDLWFEGYHFVPTYKLNYHFK